MSIELIVFITASFLVTVLLAGTFYRYVPKRLKQSKFTKSWTELQNYCRKKETWPDALINADKLLDKALARRKFKGRTMGERLVSAQKMFTNNDEVWRSHNLVKRLLTSPDLSLRESDVKSALIAFRQALRDLGALPTNHSSGLIKSVESAKK